MNVKRALLVSPLPPPVSGIGRWTEVVLDELKRQRCIEIFHVDTAVRWRGIHDLEWWRRVIGGGIQSVRDILRIWNLLLSSRPEVLHLCTSAQMSLLRDIAVIWLTKLHCTRACYHLHFGRVPNMAQNQTFEWRLFRYAARMASVVITIDNATEVVLKRELPTTKVVRLANGIDGPGIVGRRDANYIDDRKPGVARILFLGHVQEKKGVIDLVAAAKMLSAKIDLELEFVGPVDRVCFDHIKVTAGDFIEHILFRDARSHVWAMESVRRASVLALPSHTEGFPNVILEAMVLGIPVVASRVGAIAEMLAADSDNPCGVVVGPNQVGELAEGLEKILCDKKLSAKMGKHGEERFQKHYTSNAIVAQLCMTWGIKHHACLPM